jgi:PhoH-like ATPase
MPIKDNLEFLMGNDRNTVQTYFEQGVIEIEAITYIRGRSITNAFIIIDEAQNLTRHELKTILTRVGEGTKIILTGDIEQIDNAYIDETSNGLTYAVEKFKEYDVSGHITLQKGERSKVATLAAKIL